MSTRTTDTELDAATAELARILSENEKEKAAKEAAIRKEQEAAEAAERSEREAAEAKAAKLQEAAEKVQRLEAAREAARVQALRDGVEAQAAELFTRARQADAERESARAGAVFNLLHEASVYISQVFGVHIPTELWVMEQDQVARTTIGSVSFKVSILPSDYSGSQQVPTLLLDNGLSPIHVTTLADFGAALRWSPSAFSRGGEPS